MMRVATFLAFAAAALVCSAADDLQGRYTNIAFSVGESLKMLHATRRAPDDLIARRAFTNLLDGCDLDRMVFSAEDVSELAKSEDSLDDMFRKGDFSFPIRVRRLYRERLSARVAFATNLLANARFRFAGGTCPHDRRDALWPKAGREMEELWRTWIESQVLDILASDEKGDAAAAAKSVSQMYQDMLQTELKRGPETPYDDFLDAVVSAYDAHSMYMTPATFKMFSAQMSLTMCGIGLQWVMKDGAIKVTRVMPNGPAAKDGRIRAGDRIVGVASKGTNEFVRVAGMKEADLILLFQGASGEPVSMDVEHANGTKGRYTIKRGEIEIEDEAASSKVVEADVAGVKRRLGYLRLPSFYSSAPSRGNGFRSSSEDLRAELRKLKDAGVSGVVFDLRGNPGGSLDDAVKIIGLFVRRGPGVRMKGLAGEVSLPVLDDTVECETPVVVLTSHTSASAGELVPATLQDYGRAVIVGDEHTFGKGTDQMVAELNGITDREAAIAAAKAAAAGVPTESLGAVSVTEGRFYRITGGSTQLRGVESDIVVPSMRYDNKGEGGLKYPLPWNTIARVPFERCWDLDKFVPELRAASDVRRAKSAKWKRHEDFVRRSHELVERSSVPLDLSLRKKQKKGDEEIYDEMNRLDKDGFDPTRRGDDAVLDEGLNILADLVRLNGGRTLPPAKDKKAVADGVFDSLDDDD